MRRKIDSMRSRSSDSGWRWPTPGRRPGSVTSTASGGPARAEAAAATRSSSCASMCCLELVGELAEPGPLLGGARTPSAFRSAGHEPTLAREIAVAHGAQIRLARGRGEIAVELCRGVDGNLTCEDGHGQCDRVPRSDPVLPCCVAVARRRAARLRPRGLGGAVAAGASPAPAWRRRPSSRALANAAGEVTASSASSCGRAGCPPPSGRP